MPSMSASLARRFVWSNPSHTISLTAVSLIGPMLTRSAWAKNGCALSANIIAMVEGCEPAKRIPISR